MGPVYLLSQGRFEEPVLPCQFSLIAPPKLPLCKELAISGVVVVD